MIKDENTGLNILLSVSVLLFIIGLLIFVFVLIGGSLSDIIAEVVNGQVVNVSIVFNETCTPIVIDGELSNVVVKTQGGDIIDPNEYTINGNCIYANP